MLPEGSPVEGPSMERRAHDFHSRVCNQGASSGGSEDDFVRDFQGNRRRNGNFEPSKSENQRDRSVRDDRVKMPQAIKYHKSAGQSSVRSKSTWNPNMSVTSMNGDIDDFVKMDISLQMQLLSSNTAEEKVSVYKVYVSELLQELVSTENRAEDLEYEILLKQDRIDHLEREQKEYRARESVQNLSEFEDSLDVDGLLGSQVDLRNLFKQKDAEVKYYRDLSKQADEDLNKMENRIKDMEREISRVTVINRQLRSDLTNEVKRREESNKKSNLLRDKLDHLRKSSSPKRTSPELLELQHKLLEADSVIQHLQAKIDDHRQEVDAHRQAESNLQSQVEELLQECQELQATVSSLQNSLAERDHELNRVREECDHKIATAESRFQQSEIVRRQLHNQVMELKGNIRVFCRVRPPLSNERVLRHSLDEMYLFPDYDKEKKKMVLVADSKAHTSYMQQDSSPGSMNKKWQFEFDQVFDWTATQEEMFQEVAALVQSAVDGYNVSIFAYGQTGSGKTYTMQGDERALTDFSASHLVDLPNLGIVGRTMKHLFSTCKQQAQHGWTYTVTFEMYEIYNEVIRDLLATPSQSSREIATQLDSDGNVHVTNLNVVAVDDEHHAMQLLKQATARRSMKKTNRNDVSSRSHCITTLRLTGTNSSTGRVRNGAVYLIDLAGSERLKSSGSGNDPVMLKEAQNINKSLAALGNVISAIASKKSHIPFRDTKLTYVLQNTLGKDSKTLMICTLSPLEEHREESLNTLRFAKKVNSCELAVAGR